MIGVRSSSGACGRSSVIWRRTEARTSSRVTRPPLPLGRTRRRSIPMFFASLRVAGVANGLASKYATSATAPGEVRSARRCAAMAGRTDDRRPFPFRCPCPCPCPNSVAPGRSLEISPTAVAAGRLDLCAFPMWFSTDGSSTRITCPTFAISPTEQRRSSTRASQGAPIVTVALSVMTSTMGSSSLTSSPTATNHSTISPSVTPSPMSGSLKSSLAINTSPSRGAPAQCGAPREGTRPRG